MKTRKELKAEIWALEQIVKTLEEYNGEVTDENKRLKRQIYELCDYIKQNNKLRSNL